jgi:tetratricopeptide (TPR) repeat protein
MKNCFLVLAMLALPAIAQEQKQRFTINVGTPEGQLLQSIGQESDDDKKLALAQDFLSKYPKHEGAGWVTAQLEVICVKQAQYDKALEAGEKAFTNDPTDLDVAYNSLKAAEGKEDADQTKTWSLRTSELARKEMAAEKAPADDDAKQHLEYLKGVDTYADYALYALALKLKDPKQVAELGAALQQQNVKSQYMPQISGIYLAALAQSGQAGKVCPAAEKLAANAKDVDAGVAAANCGLQEKHYDRAVLHATQVIEALGPRPKPEGMSDADWASRKATLLSRANWIAGIAYAAQSKLGPADKALRASLPGVKGEPQMAAAALFQLGLANYQLGKAIGDKAKMKEGLQFFQQCADIPGTYQDQASKNVRTIKTELGVK